MKKLLLFNRLVAGLIVIAVLLCAYTIKQIPWNDKILIWGVMALFAIGFPLLSITGSIIDYRRIRRRLESRTRYPH